MSHQSLEDLVLPVTQEAVCVQRVLLAIKTQLYHVVLVLYFLLSSKCYLGGRPAEIKRSHCGSAGAEPVAHKTILQRNNRKQNLFTVNSSPISCTLHIKISPVDPEDSSPLTS